MICGYDPLAWSLCSERTGLYVETKKQASCIDVFHRIQLPVFYYIKEISAIEAGSGFPGSGQKPVVCALLCCFCGSIFCGSICRHCSYRRGCADIVTGCVAGLSIIIHTDPSIVTDTGTLQGFSGKDTCHKLCLCIGVRT